MSLRMVSLLTILSGLICDVRASEYTLYNLPPLANPSGSVDFSDNGLYMAHTQDILEPVKPLWPPLA